MPLVSVTEPVPSPVNVAVPTTAVPPVAFIAPVCITLTVTALAAFIVIKTI
ncbi:hypothetical protein FACS1894187_02190 [Synergistales bacterium]|nr:hypothetical protein FACS1894187_02190 [Synergistales bacterium]